jgi:hypothetical protein
MHASCNLIGQILGNLSLFQDRGRKPIHQDNERLALHLSLCSRSCAEGMCFMIPLPSRVLAVDILHLGKGPTHRLPFPKIITRCGRYTRPWHNSSAARRAQ